MTKQQPWFFEDRALAFAKLVLTKEHDVRPYSGNGVGLDLLVEIRTAGKRRQRLFGVQIVAFMDLPDVPPMDEGGRLPPSGDSVEEGLPFCVFVIGVRKPEGVFRWVVEPLVQEGQAVLRRNLKPTWQALNQTGVDSMIDQVNAYYDVLHGASPSRPQGRPAKTQS